MNKHVFSFDATKNRNDLHVSIDIYKVLLVVRHFLSTEHHLSLIDSGVARKEHAASLKPLTKTVRVIT